MENLEFWGSTKLSCQVCGESPAKSREYNFDDGSGSGTGVFCKKHYDAVDKNRAAVFGSVRPFSTGIPKFQGSFPKPKKKEKDKWGKKKE